MNRKIISVINQKGGVGKTTTVINLAAGLSMKGKKILVIDLDPQGNATTGLGLSNTTSSDQTIYNVLNGNKKISEVIQSTSFENLDLISSNVDLSGLEVETAGDSRRAFKLKDELTLILNNSEPSYDYIIIDCPPSLSLLTIMALVASNAESSDGDSLETIAGAVSPTAGMASTMRFLAFTRAASFGLLLSDSLTWAKHNYEKPRDIACISSQRYKAVDKLANPANKP